MTFNDIKKALDEKEKELFALHRDIRYKQDHIDDLEKNVIPELKVKNDNQRKHLARLSRKPELTPLKKPTHKESIGVTCYCDSIEIHIPIEDDIETGVLNENSTSAFIKLLKNEFINEQIVNHKFMKVTGRIKELTGFNDILIKMKTWPARFNKLVIHGYGIDRNGILDLISKLEDNEFVD